MNFLCWSHTEIDLAIDQQMTFARWVDLGCPINAGHGTDNEEYGWFLDDVRPALTVTTPRAGTNRQAWQSIEFGVADAYSGLALDTLSITANIAIEGRSPGTELAVLAQLVGDGIHRIDFATPIIKPFLPFIKLIFRPFQKLELR